MTLFTVALRFANQLVKNLLEKPSLNGNPFDYRQTIRIMHFGAIVILILGVSTFAYRCIVHGNDSLYLFFFTVGAGFWCGLRVSFLAF